MWILKAGFLGTAFISKGSAPCAGGEFTMHIMFLMSCTKANHSHIRQLAAGVPPAGRTA